MPLKFNTAFVILFSCTSMLIGAQTPATVHESISGGPIDTGAPTIANGLLLLAPLPVGDYTLAASTTGYNLPANQIGSNFAVNSDAFEYPNQFQMHDFPVGIEARIGAPVSAKSSTRDGLTAEDSVGPLAQELTVNVGIAVTPDRKATEGGTWNQESRNGPSIGVEYELWKGLFTELDYVNTNTRLQNYAINTWTMNRLSLDAGYERSWRMGRLSPFIKVGGGVMVLMSGFATNHTSAGLDDRAEILTGTGIRYRFSKHVSAALEYEGRIIRNPDFSDHGWKPERNFLSQATMGISYSFGGGMRESHGSK